MYKRQHQFPVHGTVRLQFLDIPYILQFIKLVLNLLQKDVYKRQQYLAAQDMTIRPFLEIGNTEFIINLLSCLLYTSTLQSTGGGVANFVSTPYVYMCRHPFKHKQVGL